MLERDGKGGGSQRAIALRLVFALAFAAVMTTITLIAGRNQANGLYVVGQFYRQRETIQQLAKLRAEINAIHEQTNQFPRSLTDLASSAGTSSTSDVFVDAWKRPLFYRATKMGFQLLSYGADGKPGGTGLDADLTADTPIGRRITHDPNRLTFRQFLTGENYRAMVAAALFTGVLSAMLTFSLTFRLADLSEGTTKRKFWILFRFGIQLTAIFVMTGFIGLVLAALDVPSGH